MITVYQREQIRRAYFIEQLSIREIARTQGVSRQSIRKALADAEPQPYTLLKPRTKQKLGPFTAKIEQWLTENKRLPRKQRYTATRIFHLLQKEGYTGCASNVRTFVAAWKKRNTTPALFLPLEFEPGQDAQVDWYEAQAILAGNLTTIQVFVMRLNFSRRIYVRAYPNQQQQAFLEAHGLAFAHFGGVPHRLTYDNLSAAVHFKPANGSSRRAQRHETVAFVALRSHYLFESHFCTPGQGHEKGGVEHSAGFSRRNFLVPMPRVASFEELNSFLLEQCLADDARTVERLTENIHTRWQFERSYLRPLPLRQFDCSVTRQVSLTPYSQIVFETNRYSVPVSQARCELTVRAYPFYLEILAPGDLATGQSPRLIARHPRSYASGQDIFDPLHYLPLLERRPGALAYAKPIRQWQKNWPASYQRLLNQLKQTWPQGRGVREFIQILKLHQTNDAKLVERAVEQALSFGCTHYDGVYHCLQRLIQPEQLQLPLLDLSEHPALQNIGQQPVNLPQYDQLLKHKGS
jgi:transposase